MEKGMMVLVGPEGGFEEAEEEEIEKVLAFTRVRMGEFVMRTETAPLAALSVAQSALGRM